MSQGAVVMLKDAHTKIRAVLREFLDEEGGSASPGAAGRPEHDDRRRHPMTTHRCAVPDPTGTAP